MYLSKLLLPNFFLRMENLLSLACIVMLLLPKYLEIGFPFLEFLGFNLFLFQVIFISKFRWAVHHKSHSLLAF